MATTRTTTAKKVGKRTKPAAPAARKVPAAAALPPPLEDVPVEPAIASAPAEKHKLVRDSFTMPKREYEQIAALKSRLMKLEHAIKKGELLRAGVAALTAMADGELLTAVERVQRLKTGRPGKEKATSRKPTKKKT